MTEWLRYLLGEVERLQSSLEWEHERASEMKCMCEAIEKQVEELRKVLEEIKGRTELALNDADQSHYGLSIGLTMVRLKAHEAIESSKP